jgi:hypothetical protein
MILPADIEHLIELLEQYRARLTGDEQCPRGMKATIRDVISFIIIHGDLQGNDLWERL